MQDIGNRENHAGLSIWMNFPVFSEVYVANREHGTHVAMVGATTGSRLIIDTAKE
jgi:hypothetical protein